MSGSGYGYGFSLFGVVVHLPTLTQAFQTALDGDHDEFVNIDVRELTYQLKVSTFLMRFEEYFPGISPDPEQIEMTLMTLQSIPKKEFVLLLSEEIEDSEDLYSGMVIPLHCVADVTTTDSGLELAERSAPSTYREESLEVLDALDPDDSKLIKLRFGLENGEPRSIDELAELLNESPMVIEAQITNALRQLRTIDSPTH